MDGEEAVEDDEVDGIEISWAGGLIPNMGKTSSKIYLLREWDVSAKWPMPKKS